MSENKNLKLFLIISLLLLLIAFITGCGGNNITDPEIPSGNSDSTEEVDLNFTFKQFDLDEGSFTLEVCALNTVAFNASGFSYTYYDSEGNQITELDNFVGIPFQVAPAEVAGVCGESTEVSNIPLYFNKVENYFIANPDISEIKCTIHLTGADSNNNDFAIIIVSNLPIIEQGVEIQTVIADIATTPEPPEGKVPLTVAFDATGSWTEDERGVARYCWHFGDGTHDSYTCSCPSELACPSHTYEECGSYVATLCVWDYNDNMDCAAVVVNVKALEPKMTITANPATITPHETSMISVYVTDDCDNPVPDGTSIMFNTDNGTLSETMVETVAGVAETVLTLDEAITANITAYYDGISASVTVRAVESLITVTANPATISPGDFSTISAYVVDDLGNPVADGSTIVFSTNEGILSSNFATTTDGIATVELQMTRNGTAIVTATFGALTGNTMVTCTDGPIAVIENDTDDQVSPLEITANSECPYTITFNGYESIPGTQPPLCYEWTMTHPDGTVEDLGCDCETDPYVFDECGIYVIKLTVCDCIGEVCDPCNPDCLDCVHCDSETMRIIVTDPEKPTAIITSSEPIIGSEISIIANSDCAYPITFYGDNSTTSAICGDIQEFDWTIIDPDGNWVFIGDMDFGGTPSGVRMTYDFDTCGTYLVELEITDACERIASTFVTVDVSEPEGPTAVITSSEPIVASTINVTANSDCPYAITFFGHESSTVLECGDITAYDWQIIDPEGNEEEGFDTYDTPDGIKMVYNGFEICGVYAVKLTVTDGCGNTDSETLSVIVSNPDGPKAVITNTTDDQVSPINITACPGCPYEVAFDGTDSVVNVACGDLSYAWTISHPSGGPTQGTNPAIKHAFEQCGTHTVRLVVTDECGKTDDATFSVIVSEPAAPTAVITNNTEDQVSPINITACSGCPFEVAFDGTDSVNNTACGDLSYAWTIQHPTAPNTTGTNPAINYAFEECGTHSVLLLVTDGCGQTDATTFSVIVSEPTSPKAVITNTLGQASPIEIKACDDCPVKIGFDGTNSFSNAPCGGLTYEWSVQQPSGGGPGSFYSTFSPEFTECGTHTVTLIVTDVCGKKDSEVVTVIVRECCLAANFNYSPASPVLTNQLITFDASDSIADCGDCGVVTYEWDWNAADGTDDVDATSMITTKAYGTAGTRTVTLTVTDACGNIATSSMDVVVEDPAPPVAAISVWRTGDKSVNVSGLNSITGCPGGLTSYSWNWGDGNSGTGSTSAHSYADYGTYTIELTVEDACGESGTATATIELPVPPLPFAAIELVSVDGLTVNVSGAESTTGCPGDISSYLWDWGDGDDSPGLNAGHTYAGPGPKTITLTVEDACGESSTSSIAVNLTLPAIPVAGITITDIDYVNAPAFPFSIIGANVAVSGTTSYTGCPGGIIGYDWEWDGDTAQGVETVLYLEPGLNEIDLTIYDDCGENASASAMLFIPGVSP